MHSVSFSFALSSPSSVPLHAPLHHGVADACALEEDLVGALGAKKVLLMTPSRKAPIVDGRDDMHALSDAVFIELHALDLDIPCEAGITRRWALCCLSSTHRDE